jgi:mannosyltransferase
MNDIALVLWLERTYRRLRDIILIRTIPALQSYFEESRTGAEVVWSRSPAHIRWFVFAFVFASLSRFWQLDAQSLWLDEGATWAEVTGKSYAVLMQELISPDAAYPLYHLLLKGWVDIGGDSEFWMRMPSALFGSLAIALLTIFVPKQPQRGFLLVLLCTAPMLLWHAQDAKVYSMLLCVSVGLTMSHWRQKRWWILLLLLPFVHRLGFLMIAVLLITPALQHTGRRRTAYAIAAFVAGLISVVGIVGSIRAKAVLGAPTVFPLSSLLDLAARFMADRRWGDDIFSVPVWVWILPLLALLVLGSKQALDAARTGNAQSLQLLFLAYIPVLMIVLSYGTTTSFDARYAMFSAPAWFVLMTNGASWTVHNVRLGKRQYSFVRLGRMLLLVAIGVNLVSLYEPARGIFSGAPVKEEWRVVMRELANRVTRNDLVMLHPPYALPLYRYYRRVTPDPLPRPVLFTVFSEGYRGSSTDLIAQREYQRRSFDMQFKAAAAGKHRALLVIAPDHAAQIDPPIDAQSPYGWVGLYFQYPQKTWPCGGLDRYGVALLCQSFPSVAGTTEAPQPEKRIDAQFGEELTLRGITIKPLGIFYQPNGTIPIELYWTARQPPVQNYQMFVHLCQRCNEPPYAQNDGPPLMGYGDAGLTKTWLVDDPVHDERSIVIPKGIKAGNYAVILGVYDDRGTRLKVVSKDGGVIGGDRLIVATIRVINESVIIK